MKDYLKSSLIFLIMLTVIFIPIGSIFLYLGQITIIELIIVYGLTYLLIQFGMILCLLFTPLFDKIAGL